jgi:hypothetical protein
MKSSSQHRRRQKQRAIGRRRKLNGESPAAAAESSCDNMCDPSVTSANLHASLGMRSYSAGATYVDDNSSACDGLNAWQSRREPQCRDADSKPPLPLGEVLFVTPPSPVCSEGIRCMGIHNPSTEVTTLEQPSPTPRMTVPIFGSLPVTMPDSSSLFAVAPQQQQLHSPYVSYSGQVYQPQRPFY